MTHPDNPQPPPPGPKKLDPDSPAGRAAADALSQALAEARVAIWRRQREAAA